MMDGCAALLFALLSYRAGVDVSCAARANVTNIKRQPARIAIAVRVARLASSTEWSLRINLFDVNRCYSEKTPLQSATARR